MLVVPRLQRSRILAIRLPALPGWADFGYRPSGPGSDLRFIAAYHTDSYILGESEPDQIPTANPLPFPREGRALLPCLSSPLSSPLLSFQTLGQQLLKKSAISVYAISPEGTALSLSNGDN
jgi:hypothetical protein